MKLDSFVIFMISTIAKNAENMIIITKIYLFFIVKYTLIKMILW